MDSNFDARMMSLASVITNGQHEIPRYQRRYAWEESHIRDFWNDILKSPEESHFLGSMVVAQQTEDTLEVVDGQQRLTTTMILLTAVRKHFEARQLANLADGLKPYITFTDRNGIERYRLQNVDQSAHNRLVDEVFESGDNESVGKVETESAESSAYQVFNNLIADRLANSTSDEDALIEIRDALLRARVVYVTVADRRSAFTIFETLNDRGKDLTTVDLVKNILLSKVPASADAQVERAWSGILENLHAAQIEGVTDSDFLYYFWNSKAPENESAHEEITQKRIRRSIQDFVEKPEEPTEVEARSKLLITDLETNASIFRAMGETLVGRGSARPWRELDNDWREDKWSKISQELYGILVTGSNPPLMVLLALLDRYLDPKRQLSNQIIVEFLRAIKVFQFRWSIAQKGSSASPRRMYRRAAAGVALANGNAQVREVLQTFLVTARALTATDNQFKMGMEKLVYSKTRRKDAPKVRYILTEIERSGSPSKLDLGLPTSIEHLEGQGSRSEVSPKNNWVFKLGNLTLLPPEVNAELPSEFVDKAPELKKWVKSDDGVLCQAINTGIWDASTAKSRMEWIQQMAIDIWPSSIQ